MDAGRAYYGTVRLLLYTALALLSAFLATDLLGGGNTLLAKAAITVLALTPIAGVLAVAAAIGEKDRIACIAAAAIAAVLLAEILLAL